MNDDDLAELAKGMAPIVRECVAQAITISPELAYQVANAVRLLQESPPLVARNPLPQKIIRVERDEHGNFVPVYGET